MRLPGPSGRPGWGWGSCRDGGWKAGEELGWPVPSLGVAATLTPAFLPAPPFAFMKSKFFMNRLYFSFFPPMSFLLHSAAGREASFSAGVLPRKPKVPGFLVMSSAYRFLFFLVHFSSAACAIALTTTCKARSRRVWKRVLCQKGRSLWDLANPRPSAGQAGGCRTPGRPEGGSQHLAGLRRRK